MLERLLIRWAFNVVALFAAAWLLHGVDYGNDWWTLFIAGAVFTVVNAFIKPVLAVLSIPFIVVTLGFAYLVINVLMLYITDWVVSGFEIHSFGAGLVAAIIVSLVNLFLRVIFGDPGEKRR